MSNFFYSQHLLVCW